MKHFILPDSQVRPGVRVNHLIAAGNYIAAKKPDVIIHLGDHWDMHSLSSYDRGTAKAEGARYEDDIEVGIGALELLTDAIHKPKGYNPKKIFLLGNHEERIARHVNANPELKGKLSYDDLKLKQLGWKMVPYLKPIIINGVAYAHYFHPPHSSNPYSGKCSTKLSNISYSFTMGHQQGLDVAMKHLSNGKTLRGLVAGSFYQHNEEYKGVQGNKHWRGCIMKHEVKDGNYGLMELSIEYLMRNWL